jgi:hypothetical protein
MNELTTTNIQPHKLNNRELGNTELLEIHFNLFKKLLNENMKNLRNKKILIRIYKSKINIENIRLYYNRNIIIFTKALVQDKLETIIKHSTH